MENYKREITPFGNNVRGKKTSGHISLIIVRVLQMGFVLKSRAKRETLRGKRGLTIAWGGGLKLLLDLRSDKIRC